MSSLWREDQGKRRVMSASATATQVLRPLPLGPMTARACDDDDAAVDDDDAADFDDVWRAV